jgi:hypothetical protein
MINVLITNGLGERIYQYPSPNTHEIQCSHYNTKNSGLSELFEMRVFFVEKNLIGLPKSI